MNHTYQIEFHSFWHAGSGLAGGVLSDANVIKTASKLPYLPGKTLKGLLRDAAFTIRETGLGIITDDFIQSVFGTRHSDEGTACHFTNAFLSEEVSKEILAQKSTSLLYQKIASTAIDEKGQAVQHALREIEVVIPLVLYAQIVNFPDQNGFEKQLEYCMQYIKQLGTKRHRGLGRCDWKLI